MPPSWRHTPTCPDHHTHTSNTSNTFPKHRHDKITRYIRSVLCCAVFVMYVCSWSCAVHCSVVSVVSMFRSFVRSFVRWGVRACVRLFVWLVAGARPILGCTLHVVVAATHCFDLDLLNTVVQDNINPIPRVEASGLIMASTIFARFVVCCYHHRVLILPAAPRHHGNILGICFSHRFHPPQTHHMTPSIIFALWWCCQSVCVCVCVLFVCS